MFYVIRKEGKYLKSNGWINSSGLGENITWVEKSGDGWATTSKEVADTVARYNGGEAIPYVERDGF